MILRNITTGGVIAREVEYADGLLKRLWGLRFEKFTGPEAGLILPLTKQLDTYFYTEKLNVLVLDTHKTVVENLVIDPYQITPYQPKAYYYVLLPYENKTAALVQAGHQVNWQHEEYVQYEKK